MDAAALRTAITSHLASQVDVVSAGEGFVVWVPFYYSDDDAVCLTATPLGDQGWLVSDQGSTHLHLRTHGAGVDLPRFQDAWEDLARPLHGFVPAGRDERVADIAVWGAPEDLPLLVQSVAEAALRAEGLAFIEEPASKFQFASIVRRQVEEIALEPRFRERNIIKGDSKLGQRSGHTRKVTATFVRDGRIACAIQAIGGKTQDQRESGLARTYLTFGEAEISRDQKIAVVSGVETGWENYQLDELSTVASIAFMDSPNSVSQAMATALLAA